MDPCAFDGSFYGGHDPRTLTHPPCALLQVGWPLRHLDRLSARKDSSSAIDQMGPALTLEAHVSFQARCVGGSGMGKIS